MMLLACLTPALMLVSSRTSMRTAKTPAAPPTVSSSTKESSRSRRRAATATCTSSSYRTAGEGRLSCAVRLLFGESTPYSNSKRYTFVLRTARSSDEMGRFQRRLSRYRYSFCFCRLLVREWSNRALNISPVGGPAPCGRVVFHATNLRRSNTTGVSYHTGTDSSIYQERASSQSAAPLNPLHSIILWLPYHTIRKI